MARAVYHKHQRVFVKPVGTWAIIEQVKPHWVKGIEEPVRVSYCCGLGRDFTTEELAAEETQQDDVGSWRLMRAKNKWQGPEECAHHPFPGTFPVIVTDTQDWGGWRVPGAEYDRDPARIEHQARLIASTPKLRQLAEHLAKLDEAGDMPQDVAKLAKIARQLLKTMDTAPATSGASGRSAA